MFRELHNFFRISGLPYASETTNGYATGPTGIASSWAGDTPLGVYTLPGTTNLQLFYRSSVNGAAADCNPADLTTGASISNTIGFSIGYMTD